MRHQHGSEGWIRWPVGDGSSPGQWPPPARSDRAADGTEGTETRVTPPPTPQKKFRFDAYAPNTAHSRSWKEKLSPVGYLRSYGRRLSLSRRPNAGPVRLSLRSWLSVGLEVWRNGSCGGYLGSGRTGSWMRWTWIRFNLGGIYRAGRVVYTGIVDE